MKNSNVKRLGYVGFLALVGSSACMPTVTTRPLTTTGSVRETRVLASSSLGALTSTWTTDAEGISGKVAWKEACVTERARTVIEGTVTESKPNKGGNTAWVVIGSTAFAGGLYALTKAQDASSTVSCGDGQEGSECSSPRGKITEGAVTLMATGALTAGAGIVLMSLKSTHKTKMGSSHTVKLRDRARGACAKVAALAGLKVQLEIPAGGKWEGEVDSTGAAKIKIADGVRAPVNVPMVISVASVPPSIASFVRVGEVIGEITIPEQVAAAQSPPPSKKRHR